MPRPTKSKRTDTKAEAQRIALELFTKKGYEATSLREIAERLGVSKAALYYHFESKDEIIASLMSSRGDEVAELLTWASAQKPGTTRLKRTVLRWVESTTADKLHGIRFMLANPALARKMRGDSRRIGRGLEALADLLSEGFDRERRLIVRMALLSINAAVMASAGTQSRDEEIVAAARAMALALIGTLSRA